jgi:hypothetical protein
MKGKYDGDVNKYKDQKAVRKREMNEEPKPQTQLTRILVIQGVLLANQQNELVKNLGLGFGKITFDIAHLRQKGIERPARFD